MNLEPASLGAIVVAVLACAYDLRTRRIPNALTLGSAAFAVLFFLLTAGPGPAGTSLLGWVVGCAIFLPLFLLKGMGAGDVKFLAALGAWLGPTKVFWVALYGGIAGGILAVVSVVGAGYLWSALSNITLLFRHWTSKGLGPVPTVTLADAKGPRLPYALPIAVGLVMTLWLR